MITNNKIDLFVFIFQAHLQLFHASRITLANGMRLLGLTPVEKM